MKLLLVFLVACLAYIASPGMAEDKIYQCPTSIVEIFKKGKIYEVKDVAKIHLFFGYVSAYIYNSIKFNSAEMQVGHLEKIKNEDAVHTTLTQYNNGTVAKRTIIIFSMSKDTKTGGLSENFPQKGDKREIITTTCDTTGKVFISVVCGPGQKADEVIVIISSTVSKIPDEALKPCLDYANKIGHGGDLKKLDWFPAV